MDRVGYKFSDIKVKELPLFYHLTVDLSTLLDQDDALGNDFQRFLSLMGFCMPEIGFLESRYKRPTVEALKSWPGSTVELVRILRKCEREDAVFCVRRWLGYLALLSRYERSKFLYFTVSHDNSEMFDNYVKVSCFVIFWSGLYVLEENQN